MRLLLHGSTKTRPVRGGATLYQKCPECGELATFHEVEITTAAGVFFIDVLSSTDRAYQCSACCETFDLKETADEPVEEVRPARDLAAELLAEKRQREAAVAAKTRQIDDELAALKRKLGK
jgi:hypothetical protein